MRKYIALRARSLRDAKIALKKQGACLVRTLNSSMDPALRNMLEGLYNRGLLVSVDGCIIYWLLISDEKSCCYYTEFNEVEMCFEESWFEHEKKRIRHLSGKEYCLACEKLVSDWELKKFKRKIEYKIPKNIKVFS